jgi:ribosomal-protein-alanine N-acetyltransferase
MEKKMMTPPILKTPRLRMRSLTIDDTEDLYQILQEKNILQFFPNPDTPDRTRVENMIRKQIAHWKEHQLGWWALEPLTTSQLIGWCGLQFLPETGEVEVGYLISQNYRGKGLIPEAANASLTYGFETLGLKEIIALTHPNNRSSQRVTQKIGLRYVDTRSYFNMQCCRFKITNEEFDLRKKS